MKNVIALNENCVPVGKVLEALNERTDIEHIYVIAVRTDKQLMAFASGDLSQISDAAVLLSDIAREHVLTRTLDEDDE